MKKDEKKQGASVASRPMTEEEMLEHARNDRDFRHMLWRVILKLTGSYPKKEE